MGDINYTWLEQYARFTMSTPQDAAYAASLASLRDAEQARVMLTAYNEHLRADSLQTAAVYFMHSVRGLLLGIHYMNAMCDKVLDLSLDNIRLHLVVKDGYPAFLFQLTDRTERAHPAPPNEGGSASNEAASAARQVMLTSYYRDQLRPLIEGVAMAGEANTGQMWAQLASILRWFKTLATQMDITDHEREAVVQGYEHVITMSPDILGLRKNLLKFKPVEIDSPYQPGEKTLMKSTCCLHYKVYGGQDYCYTCPKLSKAERQTRYEAIMASR
ncbi:ferric iron reductase [Paenibacillus silvae]|uniref:ferric iron reductase n=1 Tax=Paenibacillus silvae TaxID=1325358 RepID=UPI00119F5ECC|nr:MULTISPECIES: ferric iron reductase [Paenibacillus]MCK6075803.1 ferric iron reductase [Paenibacillus silvae]MCK6150191.1 ferric iron reductase [Paenibacillus silvae]MCK6268489.1 ferric iron reductase [Paenibacillus silvae]